MEGGLEPSLLGVLEQVHVDHKRAGAQDALSKRNTFLGGVVGDS